MFAAEILPLPLFFQIDRYCRDLKLFVLYEF